MAIPPGQPPPPPAPPPPPPPGSSPPPPPDDGEDWEEEEEERRRSRAEKIQQRQLSETDPVQRLNKLKELYEAGLITDEEYQAKRAEILDEI
jgi:hypothetical protein